MLGRAIEADAAGLVVTEDRPDILRQLRPELGEELAEDGLGLTVEKAAVHGYTAKGSMADSAFLAVCDASSFIKN